MLTPFQATVGFLKLLVKLRVIFLQDAVSLRELYPAHPLWEHALFSHPAWRQFAELVKLAELEQKEDPQELMIRRAHPAIAQQLGLVKLSMVTKVEQEAYHSTVLSAIRDIKQSLEDRLEPLVLMAPASRRKDVAAFAQSIAGAGGVIDPRLSSIINPRLIDAPQTPSRARPSLVTPPPATPIASRTPQSPTPAPSPWKVPLPFTMERRVTTLHQLWREWTVGLTGKPSVERVESDWGKDWRRATKDTQWWSSRKTLVEEVRRRATAEDCTEDVMAHRMEDERVKDSISLDGMIRRIKRRRR